MFISVAVRQSEANNVVNVLRDRLDSIVSFVAAPHIVIVATKATPLINVYKVSNDRFLYVLGNSTLVRKPPHPQKVVPLSNTPETGTSRPELGSASDLVFDAGDSCFVEVNLSPLQITIVRPFPNGRDIYYMPLPESGFAFSLDPSLLVEMFPRHLELDLDTMVSLFRFAAPAPRRTLFANVRRPAAGMTVNWSPESGIDCWTAQCFEPDRVVELEKSIRTEEDAIALWSDALRGSVDTLATFYHDPATPEAVMLSGGIDSSLVLANLREVITGPILSLSLSDRSAKRRQPDELTERESIEFLSRKFRTNHHYFEVDTLVDLDRVSLYSENCFDGIGSALEYYLFLSAAEQTGFETLASGFCADGLIGDLAEYERVTREIQGIQPALALYKIRQFILERTTLRGLLRRMRMPSFLSGSYLYAYYPVIEAIASNEAVVPWFAPGDLKRVNQEYMIADQEALAPFSPVDGLRHFLISDFTKIGMGTKQRIEKAARMTGHSWWSPYWNRDVMHVSLAIPIRFRNQQYSKYLSKKLVERHIGPEIAFRGKYTFSRSIPPKVSDALKMRETVLDGTVLDQLPFRSSGAKKRMAAGIATGTHSTRKGLWHLYWLEKTLQHWDRLRAKSAL